MNRALTQQLEIRIIKPSTTLLSLLALIAILSSCSLEKINNTPIDTSNYPVVSLSFGEQTASVNNNILDIPEKTGQLFLTATLSKAYDEQVIVLFEYNPLDTSASVLSDFLFAPDLEDRDPRQPPNSFEIVFAPGVTEVTFNYVNIVSSDILYETDEEISFWLRPLLNSTIDLPKHELTKLPYILFRIEESQPPPEIRIEQIKIGNNQPQPAVSEITIMENQSVELRISTATSINVEDTRVSFSLIPDAGTEEGVDYAFPFAENKLQPTDTNSEFILGGEQANIIIPLTIYSKPINDPPKRVIFSLTSANNNASISSTGYFLIVNIIDDGNNGFDLNDTGITKCYDTEKNQIADCIHPDYPNQDGLSAVKPQFIKYSSVNIAPETTPDPVDQTSWNCVYDQTTGLLWEVILPENINQFYTWFDNNPASNGGSSGIQIEDDGSTFLAPGSTLEHANDLNSISTQLCGIGEASLGDQPGKWRLPKLAELLSIMDFETADSNPLFIDNNLFNVPSGLGLYFWTASPSAISSDDAWCVSFTKGIKNAIKLCDKKTERPAIFVSTVEIIPQ